MNFGFRGFGARRSGGSEQMQESGKTKLSEKSMSLRSFASFKTKTPGDNQKNLYESE